MQLEHKHIYACVTKQNSLVLLLWHDDYGWCYADSNEECYYIIEERYNPVIVLKHIAKMGEHEYLPMSAYN